MEKTRIRLHNKGVRRPAGGVRTQKLGARGGKAKGRVARMLRRLSLLPRVSDFPMFRLIWACNF
ncbi:hypothetical protein ERO13_D11G270432v2 [Gossypium hirsutum]|uniref:Uncharacterized protein n=1 Tax=Gossypium mustelinum TaxID=34275 RepID=A0A5D2SXP0_GOSMU|nr:hypothetical protein ERO13_D11G270432v2 [Gossypium hirsutum]TYI57731.1 hypothetical protein E1A91_D11G301900v1 [Gossypium mustelinum]